MKHNASMPALAVAAPPLAVLIVEDSSDDYALVCAALRNMGTTLQTRRVETPEELQAALAERTWDIVVSDHRLPRMTSRDALRMVRAHDPMLSFVIVSGELGAQAAVVAMQAGADDYVVKDNLAGLAPALVRALEAARLRRRERDAAAALVNSREELRMLASHMAGVREQERERIARELHDEVGSTLTALKIELSLVRNSLKQQPQLLEPVNRAGQLVESAILVSTRIMHDLRPGILDEGLVAALEWQARSFEQRMGLACDFTSSHVDIPLSHEQSITLFRICQEALNNVAKHAQAASVTIRLHAGAGRLTLEIADDGRGISQADLARSDRFGLRGMRERAQALGGSISIGAPDRGGSSVSVVLPLAGAESSDPAAMSR